MNVISAVILVTLAVIGAASVVREISLRLFVSRMEHSVLLITPVRDGDNAEMVLRSAAERMRWGRGRRGCAVCLDCPLDAHTRKVCETVCRDYGFLRLMTKEELQRDVLG